MPSTPQYARRGDTRQPRHWILGRLSGQVRTLPLLFSLLPLLLEGSLSLVSLLESFLFPFHINLPLPLPPQTPPDACTLHPGKHWLADHWLCAQSACPLHRFLHIKPLFINRITVPFRSGGDRVLLSSLWPGRARLHRGDCQYPGLPCRNQWSFPRCGAASAPW